MKQRVLVLPSHILFVYVLLLLQSTAIQSKPKQQLLEMRTALLKFSTLDAFHRRGLRRKLTN